MHPNRSMIELARAARYLGPYYLLIGFLFGAFRVFPPHPMHAVAALGLLMWTLALGGMLLCAAMASLVPVNDDPPTIDPSHGNPPLVG